MKNETIEAQEPALAALYQTCQEQTKVNHAVQRKAWQPRLLSINHLELHHSRIYGGVLARIGLFLLKIYQWLQGKITAVGKWLFPQRKRIYGVPSPYHTITGWLTFGQKEADQSVPIYHMHLECWGRTIWGGFRKLSETNTDETGHFVLPYDLNYARRWWMWSVWVGIYQTGHQHFVEEKREPDFTLFQRIKVKKGDLVGTEMCLDTIQVFYWEYRRDTPMPRVVIRDPDKNAPEQYSRGRMDAIERQFIPIEIIKSEHLEMIRMDPNLLTYAKIQSDYPENLTVCMEKKQPGITRGDDWFGERMLNGMYASDFDRDPKNPELYWVHYHWNSYEKNLHYYAMPDVDIWFKLKSNGLPAPVKITLTGPLRAGDTDPRAKQTLTPEDGPKWAAAKRVARVSGALYTELAHHFAGTHVNVEQYAIAANRNLRFSPIAGLLKPYLKGVVLVNHTADRILVGNGYITSACALTPNGINQVVEKVLGTLDWKNFRPLQPISPAHQYARVANLYWEVLSRYVSNYIDYPPYRAGILEHWHEIYRFSEDAVRHSVPAFLCSYLGNAMLDKTGKPKGGALPDWYGSTHRMDLSEERPVIDGVPKAVSRITGHKSSDNVPDGDIDNLKQACAYIMFQATFGHTWANSKQYDDIGEVLYNCLGLRFGDGPDGVLGPESDTSIAPDLTRATQMMWWSNMLSRTGYGYIIANEDHDVSPHFIKALEKRRADFAALDFDIDIIQSQTNI